MTEFYDTGSAFQFQIPDSSEPGNPDGTHAMIRPHFRAETFFADFEKYINNMQRCHNWWKCHHADLWDGFHASVDDDGNVVFTHLNGTTYTLALASAALGGDISSGSNLTSGRVVKATDVKQIDTPVDLSLAYITVDAANDTAQLLAGPGKSIEIRSPDKIYFDINGTNEMIVESGKVTIAGLLDPTGLELSPVAANPGGTAANTLWADSGAGNRFKIGTNTVAYLSEVGTGDMLAANNLSDLVSDDTAVANLITGATNRTPSVSTELAGYNFSGAATSGGALTIQQIYNLITSLTAETAPATNDELALYDNTEGAANSITLANLFKVINSLTAETAPAYNDTLALYDASASSADSVTIANLFGEGKTVVVEYTGSGSSGKTVTLTGINRASAIVFFNQSNAGSVWAYIAMPDGATGTVTARAMADGSIINTLSLSAPAAGTAQVLTINNTSTNFNGSANTYRLLVIGTPT